MQLRKLFVVFNQNNNNNNTLNANVTLYIRKWKLRKVVKHTKHGSNVFINVYDARRARYVILEIQIANNINL